MSARIGNFNQLFRAFDFRVVEILQERVKKRKAFLGPLNVTEDA